MLKQLFNRLFQKNDEALLQAMHSNPVLLDVRTPSEFASGSVKGAINIPLQSLNNVRIPFKHSDVVVTFCRSGSRSAMAAQLLKKHGFTQVVNGGSWQNVERVINQFNQ